MRKRIYCLMMLGICLLFLTGCNQQEETPLHSITTGEETVQEPDVDAVVYVHVCGAVRHPGVYELPAGSRIYEAVEMAGGFRKKADAAGLNQAELLEDGMQIYVPVKGESETKDEPAKVNINTASKEELMTLTGIGEAKAEAIIQYRDKHGKFKKIEEIMNISGIKEGMFAKIESDITV